MADIDSFADEFARLAVTEGLTKGSKAYRNGRRTFFATSAATGFEEHFGRNVADLKAWQDLCKTVGIKDEDVPQSIKKCKKVSVLGVRIRRLTVLQIQPCSSLRTLSGLCRPSRASL